MCRMNTNFWACCFKTPERAPGKQLVSGFQLDNETEASICSGASSALPRSSAALARSDCPMHGVGHIASRDEQWALS